MQLDYYLFSFWPSPYKSVNLKPFSISDLISEQGVSSLLVSKCDREYNWDEDITKQKKPKKSSTPCIM